MQFAVSRINPSLKLTSLFQKLDVTTLGDFINVSNESVFNYRHEMKENASELQVKLTSLGLTLKHQEILLNLSRLFVIFLDGLIVGGYCDLGKCTLMINLRFLAEMIEPSFKQFKIEIDNFYGFSFDPWQTDKDIQLGSLSFDQMINMKLEISGAAVSVGKVVISCSNDEGDFPGGELVFHASSARAYDETGKEWSLADLENLSKEYWEGC